MLLSVQVVSLYFLPVFIGVFGILLVSHFVLRDQLFQWQELSSKWINNMEIQRLHNYVSSNKKLIEYNLNGLSRDLFVLNSLFKQANSNEITINSLTQGIDCSMHLYDLGLCEQYQYDLQKINPILLTLWFHRDIYNYDDLPSSQQKNLKMSDNLMFYTRVSYFVHQSSLISLTLFSNVFNSSLYLAAPSSTTNFNQSEREECVDDQGLENFDPRCRSWYINSRKTNKIVISAPSISMRTKQIIFTAALSNNDDQDNFISVSNQIIDISNLSKQIFSSQDSHNGSSSYEGYTVLIHVLNGTVYYHRYWDQAQGVIKTWAELEYPPEYPHFQYELDNFQSNLSAVLSFSSNSTFNFSDANLTKFHFSFTKNQTSYLTTLYPIEIITSQDTEDYLSFKSYPMLVGRVHRDIRTTIFQDSFNFEQVHLNLSIGGACIVLLVLAISTVHTIAVLRQSIDIPISLLIYFLQRGDLNLQEVPSEVIEKPLFERKQTYDLLEDKEKPVFMPSTSAAQIKKNLDFDSNNYYNNGQNLSEASEVSVLFPLGDVSRKAKAKRKQSLSGLNQFSQYQEAFTKGRLSKQQTHMQQLSSGNFQSKSRIRGQSVSMQSNTNILDNKIPSIQRINSQCLPPPPIASTQFPPSMTFQKAFRRISTIFLETQIQSDSQVHLRPKHKKKEHAKVELGDIPCLFEEMSVIVRTFKGMENVIRLAQASEISGHNEDSILQYFRIEGMLKLTSNQESLAVCLTNIGVLLLKKRYFDDALIVFDSVMELTLLATFSGITFQEFRKKINRGELSATKQDFSLFSFRLRLLALTHCLLAGMYPLERQGYLHYALDYANQAILLANKAHEEVQIVLINRVMRLQILLDRSEGKLEELTTQEMAETHRILSEIQGDANLIPGLTSSLVGPLNSYLLLQESRAYFYAGEASSAGLLLNSIFESSLSYDAYVHKKALVFLKDIFEENNIQTDLIDEEINNFEVPGIQYDICFLLDNTPGISKEDFMLQISTIQLIKDSFLHENDTFSFACYSHGVDVISPPVQAKNDKYFNCCVSHISNQHAENPSTSSLILGSFTALIILLKTILRPSQNLQQNKDIRQRIVIPFSFENSSELHPDILQECQEYASAHVLKFQKGLQNSSSALHSIYEVATQNSAKPQFPFFYETVEDPNMLLAFLSQRRQTPQEFSSIFLM